MSSWWHWGSCIYNDAKGHAGWAPLNAYRQTGDMHGVGGPCKGEVQPREERRRQNKGRRQRGGQGVTRAKRRGDGRGRRLQLKAVAVVVKELVVVGMIAGEERPAGEETRT